MWVWKEFSVSIVKFLPQQSRLVSHIVKSFPEFGRVKPEQFPSDFWVIHKKRSDFANQLRNHRNQALFSCLSLQSSDLNFRFSGVDVDVIPDLQDSPSLDPVCALSGI
jgi:hypothetical protein